MKLQGGLFTAAECAAIAGHLLDHITVLKEGQSSSNLSELLEAKYHVKYLEMEKRRGSISNLTNLKESGAYCSNMLRNVLETYHLIDVVTPVHVPAARIQLCSAFVSDGFTLDVPLEAIQNYFGCESAFYFAWLNFLTRWLCFPGLLGLFVFLLRWYRNDTIDTDEYTPFFGVITFLWGVCFLRFWEREENRLAYEWGTFSLSPYERQKFFAHRFQFRGYLRISPVTGTEEAYYPAGRRRLLYVGSALVTALMLTVAFAIMIMSLNLQGYIHPESNPSRWNTNNPHPFHYRRLATLSEEGHLFDQSSSWRGFIPVIIHVICINTLNNIYKVVSEKLTEYENHETTNSHRNSYVLKRFLFEAFDCYIALFYLAFYERDVDRLRSELVAVFQIDTLRRFFCESILPMVLQRWNIIFSSTISGGKGSLRDIFKEDEDVLHDAQKESYDYHYDDYMEIVIQLGYSTLFASAYPLASTISILANWIEIRSDFFQLAFLYRRPIPHRASDLGMWKHMIAALIWISALTNCLLAGFTSNQLEHYMPSFYVHDSTGQMELGHDKGWILVFSIFGMEHILVLIGLLIFAIVPAVPEDVMDKEERRQYLILREENPTKLHRKKFD